MTVSNKPSRSYSATAPGKVMIAGEYSYLLGLSQSLACTIDMGLEVQTDLFSLNHSSKEPTTLHTCPKSYVTIHSTLWKKPKTHYFCHMMKHPSSNDLLTTTLHMLTAYLQKTNVHLPGNIFLRIQVHSKLCLEYGVGSSAALILATTQAVSACFDYVLSSKEAMEIAIYIQKTLQPHASGYDIFTIAQGGKPQEDKHGGVTLINPPQNPQESTLPTPTNHSLDAKTLNSLFTLFVQTQNTSPTPKITHATLPFLVQSFSPLKLTQRGKTFCDLQDRLIKVLLRDPHSFEISTLCHHLRKALRGTPAFARELEKLETDLQKHSNGNSYAWKTTGAGGYDTLLLHGECHTNTETIFANHGFTKAPFVFAKSSVTVKDNISRTYL